jgi:hypothetical protein
MSYDWTDKIDKEQFTDTWFNEIDRRFVHGARLFAHDRQPFDRLIPFEQLKGRDVLEIGCGMGFHSELMFEGGGQPDGHRYFRHERRSDASQISLTAINSTRGTDGRDNA